MQNDWARIPLVDEIPTEGSSNAASSGGTFTAIEAARVSRNVRIELSKNLFNSSDERIIHGYYDTGNSYVESESSRLSHPIWCLAGVSYKWDFNSNSLGSNKRFAKCDNDGNILSSVNATQDGDYLVATIPTTGYYRFNVSKPTYTSVAAVNVFMLCKTSEFPNT